MIRFVKLYFFLFATSTTYRLQLLQSFCFSCGAAEAAGARGGAGDVWPAAAGGFPHLHERPVYFKDKRHGEKVVFLFKSAFLKSVFGATAASLFSVGTDFGGARIG